MIDTDHRDWTHTVSREQCSSRGELGKPRTYCCAHWGSCYQDGIRSGSQYSIALPGQNHKRSLHSLRSSTSAPSSQHKVSSYLKGLEGQRVPGTFKSELVSEERDLESAVGWGVGEGEWSVPEVQV